MKKVLLALLLVLNNAVLAYSAEITQLRHLMSLAYQNEASAQSFYRSTRSISAESPALHLGFKAISELMMCNHVSSPLSKLSYFKKGKRLLEQAIERDAQNAELRFMRFCTQVNTPGILNYNDNLSSDKSFLIQYLSQQSKSSDRDQPLYSSIKSFLLSSKQCTEAEKSILKKL